jgi:hypothetical protein
LPDQRLFVPSAVAVAWVKQQHELKHLGKMALEKLLDKYYFIPKLPTLCAQVSARCITCAQNNASQGPGRALEYRLQELYLLRIWNWTSQGSSPVEGTGTSWFLSAPTQNGLKLTPHTQRKHKR